MVDKEARLVHSTFGGLVTLVDFLEGRMQVLKHPDWSPSFTHVLDMTGATNLDVPDDTLRQLAAMRPIFEPGALQVVVVQPDSPMMRVVRAYQRFAEGSARNVQLVSSFDDAMARLSRKK